MSIPTPESLRRLHRKLEQQRLKAGELHSKAQAVLSRMHEGEVLRLFFERKAGAVWELSPSGKQVKAEVAAVVVADPDVESGSDGLFADTSQTWRMT